VTSELQSSFERILTLKGECSSDITKDLNTSKITGIQLKYLRLVGQLEKTTISELSDKLSLSKPTVTQSIKRLQKCGYVSKVKCQVDARIYYINLTEMGERIVNAETMCILQLVNRVESQLTVDEQKELIRLLNHIR